MAMVLFQWPFVWHMWRIFDLLSTTELSSSNYFVTITHPFAAELTFQACYNIIADFKQFLVILGCFGLGMTYFTMSWGLFWGSAMTVLGPLSLFMHKNSFWRPLQSINLQIGAKTSKKYKVKIPKFFQSNFSVVVYKMRHLILWLLNIVLEANKWILAKKDH